MKSQQHLWRVLFSFSMAFVLLCGCATTGQAAKVKAEDLLIQAQAADQAGEYDQEITLLQQAIQVKPKLAEGYYRLGKLFQERGRYDEAIGYLKVAQDLKHADAQKELAIAYFKAGKLDEAEALYKEMLVKAPNDMDLRYRLGNIYLAKGMLNEAGSEYRQVLQMDPNNGGAHNGLANLYYRQRKFEDAMSEYLQAIQMNPNLAEVNLDLGNAYYEKMKYPQAANYFKRYTELAPKDAVGYFMLAKAYQVQKDSSLFPQAIAMSEKAVKLDPNNDGAWYLLASLNRDLKNYEQSAQAFRKALELSPVDAERWYEAGKVYIKLGNSYWDAKDTLNARANFDASIECFDKACELDPAKVENSYYDKATAYYQGGKYDQAIEWFKRRIKQNPKTAYGAWYMTGMSNSLKAQALKNTKSPEAKALYLEALNCFGEARKLKMEKKVKPDMEVVPVMESVAQHYYFIYKNFKEAKYKALTKTECNAILKIDPGNQTAKAILADMAPKIEIWD
jgi:tetratricopeptide (TPR) repeat protein